MEWLGPLLLGLVTVGGAIFAYWRHRAPYRAEKRRREENAEIEKMAGGDDPDVPRINDTLDRWMRED